MKLLIVGATGGTGQQLVAQALDRGHRVTALARRLPREELTDNGYVRATVGLAD